MSSTRSSQFLYNCSAQPPLVYLITTNTQTSVKREGNVNKQSKEKRTSSRYPNNGRPIQETTGLNLVRHLPSRFINKGRTQRRVAFENEFHSRFDVCVSSKRRGYQ